MEYKIVVKQANQYFIGYMVGRNKGLVGPAMHGDDAVFWANQKQHDIITKFLNRFDMEGLYYTVEVL